MDNVKMTLRKANADRKKIDSRIDGFQEDLQDGRVALCGYYRKSKPLIGTKTPDDYVEKCKSTWQSLNDNLILREHLNKATLLTYGGRLEAPDEGDTFAVTARRFNGLEYTDDTGVEVLTIAQAIARKNWFKTVVLPLLRRISNVYTRTVTQFDQMVDSQHKALLQQVNSQFGPESQQTAKQRLEYQESIKDQYEVIMLDPLNLADRIEKAILYVQDYIGDIDSLISNATETTEVFVEQ